MKKGIFQMDFQQIVIDYMSKLFIIYIFKLDIHPENPMLRLMKKWTFGVLI